MQQYYYTSPNGVPYVRSVTPRKDLVRKRQPRRRFSLIWGVFVGLWSPLFIVLGLANAGLHVYKYVFDKDVSYHEYEYLHWIMLFGFDALTLMVGLVTLLSATFVCGKTMTKIRSHCANCVSDAIEGYLNEISL